MSPSEHFSERLGQRERLLTGFDRMHERIGTVRLVLAGAFLATAWLCIARRAPPQWLLAPAGLFVVLVIYHQRIRTLRGLAQRAVAFHRAGLARLQGQHRSQGLLGDQFNDEHHVYGGDLDLFGKQSLYEQLCTARTPMGESILARWLLAPAGLAAIRERQSCVAELRGRVDLREDLAILGEPSRIALHPDTLAAWASAPDELPQWWLRSATLLLAAAAIATAALWAVWGLEFPFLAVLVIEAGVNYALRNRVQRCVSGVEHAYEDLKLLSLLLRRIETEAFESPALRALSGQLSSHALTASATLSKLATIVNFVEARRNPFLAPLMLPLMYTLQSAVAAERWRRLHGHVVASWLSVLGEFEALESIAGYSFERPDDPFPEFVEGPATFIATGLGHPLIAPATRVRNDVDISGETRVLLVSGSNMSGKSTLLRSVGMNTVLAMAGAPVCAVRLLLTPLQVGASIRVNDSCTREARAFTPRSRVCAGCSSRPNCRSCFSSTNCCREPIPPTAASVRKVWCAH